MLGINLDDGRILGLGSADLWVFVHCAPYISRKALKPEKLASILSANMEAKQKVINLITASCGNLADIGIFIEKKTGYSVDPTLISGKAPKLQESIDNKSNQRWSDKCESYLTINGHVLNGEALDRFKLFVKAFGQHGDLKGGADSWWKLENSETVDVDFMNEITVSAKSAKISRDALRISNPSSTGIFMQGWITKRRWESDPGVGQNTKSGFPVNPRSLR